MNKTIFEQAGTAQVGVMSKTQQIVKFWGKMKTKYPEFENVISEL